MLSVNAARAVLALMLLLGLGAIGLSISILRRGRFYHWLKPDSRPRRWVLILMLGLFAVFVIWFPVWMIWPHALISRVLTLLFAVTWGIGFLTLRWFSGLVDRLVQRKGWSLR